MLPLNQAIRLPIILTRKVHLFDLSGKIKINGPVKFSMIRFGYFGEDTAVAKDFNTLLKIRGTLIFNGGAHFGIGVTIRVENGATFEIGNNVRISNQTKIICYEKIEIGNDCRIAWECQIIDTTFHYIRNKITGEFAGLNASVKIGNNNWIGNRSNIMKGTETPDFCIIAGGSLCNQKYDIQEYSLIAGTPAKLKKTNVYRVLDEEEKDIKINSNITTI
ncbi:acyltransferase [Gaetbulibacter aquiaggeris]|uniref:Acyltransferase n=1 Tax=Gaetbulibacter aquiaggeris TaxID=1735373 RepID=A0ABW7MRT3_9FLAO